MLFERITAYFRCGPKYRGFATSDPRSGVHLTEKGRAGAARLIDAIGHPTFEGKPIPVEAIGTDPRRPSQKKERSYNPAQVLEKCRSRLLFRRYKEGRREETDVVHLLGLIGLYDHSASPTATAAFRSLFYFLLDFTRRRVHLFS